MRAEIGVMLAGARQNGSVLIADFQGCWKAEGDPSRWMVHGLDTIIHADGKYTIGADAYEGDLG
jgi:hypothetical protein